MRRVFLFSLLIIVILLAGACATPPAPEPAPPPPPPRVTEDLPPPPPPPPPVASDSYNRHPSGIILDGATTYTVQRGDVLNQIARQRYQDGALYPLISMVNGNITDVDELTPGMALTIPDVRLNLNDSTAKASINRYFLEIARLEEQRGRTQTAALIRNHAR